MAKSYLDGNGVLYLWQKIKAAFVAKEDGKKLSSNDYTDAEKDKLSGIAEGANKTVIQDNLTSTSSGEALSANQGKVLDDKITGIKNSLSELGGGDMLKATYDTDNNGQVDKADNADKFGGQLPSYYAKSADLSTKVDDDELATVAKSGSYKDLQDKPTDFAPSSHTHAISDVTGLADALNSKAETKTDVGLGNVDNTSDLDKPISTATKEALDTKVNTSVIGQASGIASLDETGKIPSTQLPSYVDDVVEGYAKPVETVQTLSATGDQAKATIEGFYVDETYETLITPEKGKIYIDLNTNISYRWGGSIYIAITSSDMTYITNAEIDSILSSVQ